MKDGSVLTNPGIGNPAVVHPVGPVDTEVGVLGLRRLDSATLGLLASFSLHYVGIPEDANTVSADYFGFYSQMIQRLRGESFVAALANGACADVNNIDVMGGSRPKNDRYQHTERVAARVAAAALWAWNEMEFTDDAALGAAMTEVLLRRRPAPTDEERQRAGEIEARVAAGQPVTMGERAFVGRTLRRAHDVPEELPTWVQALRIGDQALVGVPGELFVELGLAIKQRSPFAQTMVLELANDSVGYLPTRRAYEEGAYEPEASLFAPGVGEQIVEAAVGLLECLHSTRTGMKVYR
jgi:hypothetical protein